MKKKIVFFMVIFILISGFFFPVYAEETENPWNELKEEYNDLLESSGANDLWSELPDDSKAFLEENKINQISPETFLDLNFFDFIKNIGYTVKQSIQYPITILMCTIGVILLYSLINSLKSNFQNSSYERVFSVVSVMCVSASIIIPIAQMITKTADVIKQISTFLLSFIPIYTGIITASGKPLSAVSYHVSLIGVVQVISSLAATVLVPMLAVYLAFCLIGSTSLHINVDGIARSVKTIVIVVLSFLMTIFVGLLTIQGIVAVSGDSVSMKAAKFALSAFLPVVGAAISEALNSVQGCMTVVKSTVGGFGIVAVVGAFLPSVISILMMQLSLNIAAGVSDMLDTSRITVLLKSASSVLSLLLGILLTFFVLLTVSVTIMLTLGNGGV